MIDLTRIPDGADRAELFDWTRSKLPYRDGGLAADDFAAALAAMRWFRVTKTRRFWGDDRGVLSRATASLTAGLTQLATPVAVRAAIDGEGLRFCIGLPEALAEACTAIMGANLPGLVLMPERTGRDGLAGVGRDRSGQGAGLVPLWARPDPDAVADAPALLDRLASLRGVEAELHALLLPVGEQDLDGRGEALDRLADLVAKETNRQVQVSPIATNSWDDPRMTAVSLRLDEERARLDAARRVGAFGVFAQVSAADRTGLAAAVGAVASASPSTGCTWRPVPTRRPGDHRLPLALLSSVEAVDLLRVPAHDVAGLPSRRTVRLDEHPEPIPEPGPVVRLGHTDGGVALELPMDALTSHVLVTGGSGAGKTSVVAALLHEVARRGIPVLVVEPVRDEWGSMGLAGLRWWAPGSVHPGEGWPLPVLEVPAGVTISSHLQWLTELFRSSLDLPDPLPAVMGLGLSRVFETQGWDLVNDRHLTGRPRSSIDWPTISELVATCHELIDEERYDPTIRGNLHAALDVRVGVLTRGPLGRDVDTTERCPVDDLFGQHVVCNLDAIADPHVRSFLSRLLLLRIVAHRKASPSRGLAHLTVLEEAHVLLSRGSAGAGGVTDPVGDASEAFGDQLAEVRAVGEGFVVIDQSPSRLVRSAIVNTATKISLRSVDREDHQILGGATNLDEDEQRTLATLSRHEALVVWEGMDRPVRGRMAHRYLVPRSTERPFAQVGPPVLSAPPQEVHTAVALLARANEAERPWANINARKAVALAVPGTGVATADALIETELARELLAMSRAHGWTKAQRERALRAVHDAQEGPDHPADLLMAAPQPALACPAVCPSGGCRTGSVTRGAADLLAAGGLATNRQLVNDPEERRRRIRRRVLALAGLDAPVSLHHHLTGCLTVQLFDRWFDPETVESIVSADWAREELSTGDGSERWTSWP